MIIAIQLIRGRSFYGIVDLLTLHLSQCIEEVDSEMAVIIGEVWHVV